MSVHINAPAGAVAETVLFPGDPLRARFIAEEFLDKAEQYNSVRGMAGYTGLYKGRRVSVQGSGMGQPSLAIYTHELINEYGVRQIIRVGSCGSLQAHVKIHDIILAMTGSTNSSMNHRRFRGMDFAPAASFPLLLKAYHTARDLGVKPHTGGVLSSDTFYEDDPQEWKLWAAYNVLAVEMETSALYTLAARFGIEALSILTVSDSLVSGESLSSHDREKSFTRMMEIALSLA